MKAELDGKVSYFEGWYFKHQNKKYTICFIPGMQIDKDGNASAFIQIIDKGNSYFIKYPMEEYECHPNGTSVRIGENIFTKRGMKVNINTSSIKVKGKIRYGDLMPIGTSIMGPFSYLPWMHCQHDIISMKHYLSGSLRIHGKKISFDGGIGYMEKDRGRTFPKSYYWTQCNGFRNRNCSITAAVADINFIDKNGPRWLPSCVRNKKWNGCFAVIGYEGKRYRLATYLGASVVALGEGILCLKQGKKSLLITSCRKAPKKLKAPRCGKMNRIIHEDVCCYARYRFFIRGKKVFDLKSNQASMEYVKK